VEAPAELPFEPPCILCLGRLVPEKGVDVALRVLANVRLRVPGVRLVVAGDGGERSRLEREARELGLGEEVRFVGAVAPEDVPAVINRATLVLMPSRREGLPLVAIEAALMGRPVVATAVSGLAEVVTDGETGRLAAKDDVEGLSRAVLDLLAHPERTRRMGRSARERARDRFGLARCTASFDALYRRLVPSWPEAAAAKVPR
jgi:glycogen(starch) synthase